MRNGTVLRGSVERLLDRDHLRVFGSCVDEVDDWAVRLVRVIEQLVAFGNRFKNSFAQVLIRCRLWLPGFVFQFWKALHTSQGEVVRQ